MSKGIWITWEMQRRNRGISKALKWPLFEIDIDGAPRLSRYVRSLVKTADIIRREKPDVVVAQNPSIVLALWTAILSRLLGFVFIMDAHNSGIQPFEGKSKIALSLARWLQRRAALTIVTNLSLKSIVDSNGGRGICLPDALPEIPSIISKPLNSKFAIAFICTFGKDEPFAEVFSAARGIHPETVIYTTGRFQGKVDPADLPANVRLAGFIPDQDFWELLASADAIMDLTVRDDCLVCGAYEGVALGKPLILSNTPCLRSYFNKGTVYVDPTAESIAKGISLVAESKLELQREIVELKENIEAEWQKYFLKFQKAVQKVTSDCPQKHHKKK
jgi:Glycosyl transferase 4-like